MHGHVRLRTLLTVLAAYGLDLMVSPEDAARSRLVSQTMQELSDARIDPEAVEAAGGSAAFVETARTCLDMQAELRKIGVETTMVERLLLHARMVREQESFGRMQGYLVFGGAVMGIASSAVQRFADYEARCAREAALCGCGPAGVAQLDDELRGREPPIHDVASAFAALREITQVPPAAWKTSPGLSVGGRADARAAILEVNGRRGPGRQLRDERERVGEPLRILAAYTHMTVVELGEIERGIRVPTPEQWAALQVALPDLGPMEAPPTEAERSPVRIERDLVLRTRHQEPAPGSARARLRDETARLQKALHPAGRCTCGAGGDGTCEWCVMDRRRDLREARRWRRLSYESMGECRCGMHCPPYQGCRDGEASPPAVTERARKREARRAKQARKARRGW